MTSLWYWLLFFLAAVAVLAGPWLCARLDDRADRRDREAWRSLGGGRW